MVSVWGLKCRAQKLHNHYVYAIAAFESPPVVNLLPEVAQKTASRSGRLGTLEVSTKVLLYYYLQDATLVVTRLCGKVGELRGRWVKGYLEKGIQTSMAQGRSTQRISIIEWIRTSRLSIKNSLSGELRRGKKLRRVHPRYKWGSMSIASPSPHAFHLTCHHLHYISHRVHLQDFEIHLHGL